MSLAEFAGPTTIEGDLIVEDNGGPFAIDGLDGVQTVGGKVWIVGNEYLTGISGLGGLTSIGNDLRIGGNPIMGVIDGLGALETVGGELTIDTNEGLAEITGLANLREAAYLSVGGSPELHTFDLPSLYSASGISIGGAALQSIDGFNELQEVSNITLSGFPVLFSLAGFGALTDMDGILTIEDTEVLPDIAGFQALQHASSLEIDDHQALTRITGFGALQVIDYTLSMQSNPKLPVCYVTELADRTQVSVVHSTGTESGGTCP
jgi:hypothetical protein